eukprot:scaffold75450_cov49-Attheya_sp.AAC.1
MMDGSTRHYSEGREATELRYAHRWADVHRWAVVWLGSAATSWVYRSSQQGRSSLTYRKCEARVACTVERVLLGWVGHANNIISRSFSGGRCNSISFRGGGGLGRGEATVFSRIDV